MSQPRLIDIGNLMSECLKGVTTKERIQHGFKDPATLSRIKYFYKLLRDLKCLECDIIETERKNNGMSAKFRDSGNKMFARGPSGFNDALELYNEAICWAEPKNGEELALAYGNRSAVYFEWMEYDLCRANMQMAKDNGFPARLMHKLDGRDAQCIAKLSNPKRKKETIDVSLSIDGPSSVDAIEAMNPIPMFDYDKNHTEANLSFKPNPKYPFAANCLVVKYDSKKGQRVVVTNEDLKPGQIVSVEMPIVTSMAMKDRRYRYRKCAKCYEENCFSLIPCPSCTNTMYCSKKCMDDSHEHHQYECPISDFLLSYCHGDSMSIRLLLQAYASFDSVSNLAELCKTSDESEQQIDPERFSYEEYDDGMSAEEKYRYVHGFETNQSARDDANLLLCYCKVAALYHVLTHKTTFIEMLKSQADHDNLMKLLMRIVQISNMNSITCTQYKDFDISDDGDDKSITIYSQGIYPLASLLKHSCAPNVLTISNGTKLIAYVSRVIEKGSQLTRSMGIQNITYFQHTKSARQQQLNYYGVNCDCEACINDYPPHHGNLPEGKLPDSYNFLLNMRHLMLDLEVNNLQKFLDILYKHNNELPCLSLNELLLRVHKIMKLKYGDLGTGLKMSFKLHPLALARAGH